MAAATITTSPEGKLEEDNVVLTVSDGETYITRLSEIILAHATWNEDMGNGTAASLAYSGTTVTVHAAGVVDKKLALCIKGNL